MSVIIDGTSGITSPNLDLTSGQLAVADGGTGVATSTGTGATVRAVSPALTTPDLGTPSALVGTNITGTANSLNAGLGVNQTWQSFTVTGGSPPRAMNTTYTNTSGKPIVVSVFATFAYSTAMSFLVDGIEVAYKIESYTNAVKNNVSTIVPNGSTYRVNCGVAASAWVELR